jgi:tetratricopeptide (TPR) repeat protein
MGGHMQNAADDFQQAAKSKPLSESDRFTLAMALVKLGRHDDARRELNALATREPGKAIYSYWLGRIDYDQRRYDEAIAHLKQATELDAKSARAWDSLGLAYDMQGKSEEALKALQEGVRLNREQAHPSPWPPHDLGALLLRMEQTKQAEAAFREALQLDPQMEQAHYHLGRALEKEGVNDEAINEYRLAVNEDQTSADACYSLAMLYRRVHRDQDAAGMFAEWRKRRDAQQ